MNRVVDAAAAPVFVGPERARGELFSTVFHGLVNLLVELFALTAAFVFFLSAESTRAVQNQIVGTLNRPALLGAAARGVQEAFARGCAETRRAGEVAEPAPLLPAPQLPLACCAPGGSVRATADALRAAAELFTAPAEIGGDAAQVQNVWVLRFAVLFCGLGLVALAVAYVVNRLAGGPRVPLARIVLYNVLLFIFAFGVQVAFMGLVTLRYVPIAPSEQLRAIQRAVQREEAAAGEGGAQAASLAATQTAFALPDPAAAATAAPDPEAIVPRAAAFSAAVVLALIAAVALVLFLAWRARAFRAVSTVQGLCVQLVFIFAIMVGVYFWLSNSIGAELQENAIRETVGYVGEIARKVPVQGAARSVWASVRASLDAQEEGVMQADRAVAERNALIVGQMKSFATVLGAALLAVLVVSAIAHKRLLRWRFWVGILLVGLVGASTTLLVEYGFAQNVLRNYRPVSAPQLARGLASGLSRGVEQHAQWFCEDARCGDAPRALQNDCCAPGSEGPEAQGVVQSRLASGRDVSLFCGDDSIWSLDDLYASSAPWFEDVKQSIGAEPA